MDAGLLIARVLLGLAISARGVQKRFGSSGDDGLKRIGGFFEGIGFRPGVSSVMGPVAAR
jgi:putative oxidoreductase